MTAWRYIARRALTNEFLAWDVPIRREQLTWGLSGGHALRGSVDPDVGRLRADDGRPLLEEWGTELFVEADGQIRWGGIVVHSAFDGPKWSVECAGYAAYPHGIPYLGEYQPGVVDPFDAVREIWRHVQQDYPDGNLSVAVSDAASPMRVGTAQRPYKLVWWETRDCGQEIDTLARQVPFDYDEAHGWNADRRTIWHRIDLAYPRLGRRRFDLAFEQDVNVSKVVQAERDGGRYANEVVGVGAGEGRAAIQRRTAVRDGRLRRPVVYSDKSITDTGRMDALIRSELAARRNTLEFPKITVRDHPHARIGSWRAGDDILVRAELPWLGEVAIWHRIVDWSLVDDAATAAELSLIRSDAFVYGSVT